MKHVLRSWPRFFAPLLAGDTAYDARKNDRNFSRGDTVVLREWIPDNSIHSANGEYTGRELEFQISHVLRGAEQDAQCGLGDGFVILGLKPISKHVCKTTQKKGSSSRANKGRKSSS